MSSVAEYVVQASLLNPDEDALVCPNCKVHLHPALSWVTEHGAQLMPCPLCGARARVPRRIEA